MKHEIIKTENYLLVSINDDIKRGWFYCFRTKSIFQDEGEDVLCCNGDIRIIAHLPLNGSPYLEGVDVLPKIEDGSNSDLYYHKQVMNPYGTGEQSYTTYEKGFIDGYNKSKETYKYTEEDMKKTIEMSRDIKYVTFSIDEIIQSLNQPKLPIAFECETHIMNKGYTNDSDYPYQQCEIPKTITNLEGRTEWVGKYIW